MNTQPQTLFVVTHVTISASEPDANGFVDARLFKTKKQALDREPVFCCFYSSMKSFPPLRRSHRYRSRAAAAVTEAKIHRYAAAPKGGVSSR